jgi:hypothetical protein
MYFLNLKNGIQWIFNARTPKGNAVLRLLADAMLLEDDRTHNSKTIKTDAGNSRVVSLDLIDSIEDSPLETIPVIKTPMINWPLLVHRHSRFTFINAFRIAQLIGLIAEEDGGILIHGALAEKDGRGIVLAGPSGAGKSTASKRLPVSWNSLSDDTVLIVKRPNGEYWAHPWPTWSRIDAGDQSEHVDTKHSVHLAGIFFLQKARNNAANKLEKKNAVGMLLGCAEVATGSLLVDLMNEKLVYIRQRRFFNLYDIVSSIQLYNLKISRHGKFWKRIERVLSV